MIKTGAFVFMVLTLPLPADLYVNNCAPIRFQCLDLTLNEKKLFPLKHTIKKKGGEGGSKGKMEAGRGRQLLLHPQGKGAHIIQVLFLPEMTRFSLQCTVLNK